MLTISLATWRRVHNNFSHEIQADVSHSKLETGCMVKLQQGLTLLLKHRDLSEYQAIFYLAFKGEALQFVFCVHHGDSTTGFSAFSSDLLCSDGEFAF